MGKWLSVSPHLYLVLMLVVVLGFHCVNGQEIVPSPPVNLKVTTTTATSIAVTWEHPGGLLDSYELTYLYIINECNNMRDPPVTVTLSISQNNYTIVNGPNTPVEEDSEYSISLFAVNSVGRSSAARVLVTTPEAVPGIPEELQTVSTNVTNITIRWDRVNCRDRNGHTDSYRVVSYPTLSPSDQVARTVVGTEDNRRMFSITGLPPRTNYTFEVQASNPNIDMSGSAALYTESTTAPQDLGFLLEGQLYRNNSVVTVTDIGTSTGLGIYCLTPSLECCSDSETPNAASVTREWYLPDGRPVASDNSPFIKNRVSSAVSLHEDRFSFNTAPSGVYRCEIPDASGTSQNIYVGIYPQGDGSPSITSLLFERNSTTLTCTSTGGPPTTVTWRKDGQPINETRYQQSQRLVDAERATYENVLFDDDVASFVGSFTCEVSNVRGMTQETTVLNGVSVVRDQLNIGISATASCFSDAPATRMEWLQNGVVIASDTSTQRLDLEFSPVSDSIHNQVYVCRVTRQGGAQAEQNFTAIVDVPPDAITATVSSSGRATAGMVYSLTCSVSKTVGGLTNSPTAIWTTRGVAVTNGNGITVTDTTGDTTVTSTLTFDPLRTSHEGSFVCSGTLTSPALDTALMPSATEELEIRISTPDVVMTVPSGPLFAGRIAPLTLTCTISINSATDTRIEISDMDITWLRGSTRLSNGDARVTISSVTSSRPSFTSSLTLDPLSTTDNTTFTCRARARPPTGVASLVIASEMGEGVASVIVNLPSPPTVSIDPFNRLEMAGQPLTLTCSASIQEGIRGTPVLTWTKEDGSLSSDVTSAPPLLSFPSLRTSDAGRYTCTARLSIPEAAVDVSGVRTTNVSIQFMPPPPIISGSPRNTSFFQGLDLIFTCIITLGDVVDTPVTVQGIWNRNGTELMDGDENGRITIINTPMSSPPYGISLRFNPLNVTDAGTYECHVTVTPQDTTFISTATTSNSRTVNVSAFPTQFVDVTAEGISAAGVSGYTLICNTSKEPDLPSTSTLAVEWLDPRGDVISSGENFTISGVNSTTDVGLISRLVFNSLYTSQAGDYTCRTFQTIPGIVTNHPESVIFPVRVKLPAPISPLTFRRSRNTTLNAGTTFSLTCIITPNTTGVDTDIIVESSIVGNGISDTDRVSVSPRPVSVGENTFETNVTFSHLLEADAGAYNCSANISSPPSLPNVITSDSTSDFESISIGPLQAPTVSVSPVQGISVEAGGQGTITCTAAFDEHLVERPTLVWEFPQGSGTVDTTMGDQQSGIRGTTTRMLTFDRIHTSQAGVYTCRATIDIQGIDTLSWTANQTVRVQIPRPVFSVLPHPTAYNGTNLTIMGRFQQNSNVDTDVTISGTWSGGTSSIVTTAQIMLSLLPVATDSSGEYTVTYTIRSSDNSPHIIEYNGEDSYNLAVESLPSRPPTISIVSRRRLDGCGEVMTLNCTATQVENLFSPPTIVWMTPDASEVPTVESSNPRMDPQTRELVFSAITPNNRGQYTCRSVVNIPQAQIDDYTFGTSTVQVSTDFPGEVRNLVCAVSSASELSFSWDLPTLLGSEVVSYQVIVNRLEHRPGTREVMQSAVDEQFVESLDARVTGLAIEVPYNITVKALNLAGCGEERQTYCFTQEGEPPQPMNVVVTRVDATTMTVTWDKLTLVELKGLANYTITYSLGGGSRKRQTEGMVTVPWTENSVTIRNLQSGAAYSVTVGTRTSAGDSSGRTGGTLEAVSNDIAAIVGGIIAAILFVILVVLIILIVFYVVRRRRMSKFSPGHMYDTGAKASTEERELQPLDNGNSQPAISDKEKEALEESAIVPPPTEPRSAITTEVLDRMKPVSQASFRDHVAEKHEDRDKGFEAEYQSFGTDPVNSHEIAKLPINRPKNRFANIFPYDHSRVKLNILPGEEGSDYINACSLDGYKRQGCYIAAQGPMPNTIGDFWRMIWEKRLPNIVMLTKCLEAGRRKCEQYWADNIGEDYQTPDKKLNITTTSVMPYADFAIRTFSVKSLMDASLDPLSVTQYHFTSWPDHGVPKFATSLISFIRRVQRGHTKDSGRQLVVHCSAGVGRTGTFITLDSMLDRMAAKEPDVNVYEFVYNMRQRRVLMVQTLAQYVFIHDALNELITCGQTDIVASALRTKVNFLSKVIPAKGITGFQNQFQLLEQVSRLPADEDLTDAMETYNQGKNRYPDKIPYNMSRARLRPTGEDGSEYINASFIDGYKQRNAYIATQGPLQNTVNDIWRMLYEFKSRTLVMLCNMNEDGGEASYPFFPSKEEEPVKYGKMLVTLQSKASYTDFIVRKFSIQEDKGSPKNDGFVVTQFHLTEWPPHQVPNTGTLIEMLDMVTKNQMSTGNRPITVMCNDGVGRTGTFICIHAQLERLKTEGVVDFFQSIKSARIQRAGLVPDVNQYAFCHTVLADYIDKFDNYANFKDMIM